MSNSRFGAVFSYGMAKGQRARAAKSLTDKTHATKGQKPGMMTRINRALFKD